MKISKLVSPSSEYHSFTNRLVFKMNDASALNFYITGYCTAEGTEQNWKGITNYETTEYHCDLFVEAARKPSQKVASWFNAIVGEGGMIACSSFNSKPAKLNFAFTGNLSFTHNGRIYEGQEIVLGQGFDDEQRPNWWIGGENMTRLESIPILHSGGISQHFGYDVLLMVNVNFIASYLLPNMIEIKLDYLH